MHRVLALNRERQLMLDAGNELQKPLVVEFVGEQGVDEGGLRKEFFHLLLKEIMPRSESGGTFFKWYQDARVFWFWPGKSGPPGAEDWLRDTMTMIGTLLGLAIYNGVLLDTAFPLFVYEMLIDGSVLSKGGLHQKLQFLAQIEPAVAKSLQYLLRSTEEELQDVDQTFQIMIDKLNEDDAEPKSTPDTGQIGVQQAVELKPGGANLRVTASNRREFCELYCNFLLDTGVAAQLRPLRNGFLSVIGGRVITLCTARELALMSNGLPLSSGLHDLEAVAVYHNGYKPSTPVIRWFWQLVHRRSDEWRRRLFQFIFGTDRVPLNGLKSIRFVVQRAGDRQNLLPVAHTCFNTLDLPEYQNPAILEGRLDKALEHVTGFGLV